MDHEAKLDVAELLKRQSEILVRLNELKDASCQLDAQIESITNKLESSHPETPSVPSSPQSIVEPTPPSPKAPNACTPPPLPTPPTPSKPSPTTRPTKPKSPDSPTTANWEISFGQTWLVRLGVFSLLTGLVFLSTYVYKNWFFQAPAPLKVGFFMTLSLALSAAGTYFEKSKKNLKHYGQVLTTGGLVGAYYTLYAAHFTESLYCISSPVLAGALLTVWAALILAYADWKKSQPVSIIAIVLAFYGVVLNPSGWISLFSATLLSAGAMCLAIRHSWKPLALTTPITAFLSHLIWLCTTPAPPSSTIQVGFLLAYWAIFSLSVSKPFTSKFDPKLSASILFLNNTATWAFSVFLFPSWTPRENLGELSLYLGAFYLTCAALTYKNKLWHKAHFKIFLTQGLFILTLGIITETHGYYRFLLLGLESIVLLSAGIRSKNLSLKVCSLLLYLITLMAAFSDLPLSTTSYSLLAFISLLFSGLTQYAWKPITRAPIASFPALVTWLCILFAFNTQTTLSNALLFCSITATSLWTLFLITNKPESLKHVAFVASLLPLATLWIYLQIDSYDHLSWLVIPIGLTHWYTAPNIRSNTESSLALPPLQPWLDHRSLTSYSFSIFTFLLVYQVLSNTLEAPQTSWLYLAGAVAIFAHLIGSLTHRLSISIPAIPFHILALTYVNSAPPANQYLPFTLLCAHLALNEYKSPIKSATRNALAPISTLALYLASPTPAIPLTLLAISFFVLAHNRRDPHLYYTGTLFSLLLASTAARIDFAPSWFAYLPMLTLLTLSTKIPSTQNYKAHNPLRICAEILTMLLLVSYATKHTLYLFDGNGLAICLAILATLLFTLGLSTQYRLYRLSGLLLLAASFGHVITIDVMQLNTLARILSFLSIGLILIGLGYLYHRFQERIQRFL
ncbi:DUF2339 domain-containing protein [Rubritalea tangerina]|uniref:DUF2339 domain-containing protein n=1 Tax=Rubritalea tangerina TaxID=430798 RepID=A0ABW4Z9J2_9BACT